MAVIVGAASQTPQPADPAAPSTLDAALPAPAPNVADGPLVALVLPLSGRQEALGMAVRDGFIARLLEAPDHRRFNLLLIDEARVSAAEAHRQALDAGARALVGPLLKESVQAMAPQAGVLTGAMPGQMPVLALNNLADGDAGAGTLWQFGLAPEDEARQVAARASALNQRRALVLVPASEWGQRLANAFAAEFTDRGGQVVETRSFAPGDTDYSATLRGLLLTTDPQPSTANPGETVASGPGRRTDADLIFVAANSSNGRQIMPQLRFFGAAGLPTYSTSAIWDDGETQADDLNGVVFPDAPWVIEPDARALAVKNGLLRHWGRNALGTSRLYALGYDAGALLPAVLQQPVPGALPDLAGATGTLFTDSAGRIHRRLPFAEVRGGRLVPLPDAGPPLSGAPVVPTPPTTTTTRNAP